MATSSAGASLGTALWIAKPRVRRTLRAETLPQWETVEVIFLALCQIADVDPDDIEPNDDPNPGFNSWDEPDPLRSHRDELERRWRLARYGEVTTLPRTREMKARQEAEARAEAEARNRRSRPRPHEDDPWGNAPATGTFGGGRVDDDEPPF